MIIKQIYELLNISVLFFFHHREVPVTLFHAVMGVDHDSFKSRLSPFFFFQNSVRGQECILCCVWMSSYSLTPTADFLQHFSRFLTVCITFSVWLFPLFSIVILIGFLLLYYSENAVIQWFYDVWFYLNHLKLLNYINNSIWFTFTEFSQKHPVVYIGI